MYSIQIDYIFAVFILDKKLSHLILFTNPSARVAYDTRSIFKRSLTVLNLEFSFS